MNYEQSLEELIEACGENLSSLDINQKEGRWWTVGHFNDEILQTGGKTPSEAVARLLQEINDKKHAQM